MFVKVKKKKPLFSDTFKLKYLIYRIYIKDIYLGYIISFILKEGKYRTAITKLKA